MRAVPLVRVACLLAGSALWFASTGASTPEDLAAAQRQRVDAFAAVDAAKTALADIEAQLDKLKSEMADEYLVLDEQVRRRNREEEAKSRATIQTMKKTREDLWISRDLAWLVLSLREAESESAAALCRIQELGSSASADPSEIRQLEKKHEKAVAKARRLQREVDAAERPAG